MAGAASLTGEFKYDLGDGTHATLRYSESATALSLDVVLVPAAHRARGVGTALIHRVLCLADCTGRDVLVVARPIGALNAIALARLVSYYQRFGFVEIDRGVSSVRMRRPAPAGPSSVDAPD